MKALLLPVRHHYRTFRVGITAGHDAIVGGGEGGGGWKGGDATELRPYAGRDSSATPPQYRCPERDDLFAIRGPARRGNSRAAFRRCQLSRSKSKFMSKSSTDE